MMDAIPCPRCKADLGLFGEITLAGWVDPDADPEGKARADLILECVECGEALNAFVPFDEFQRIEEAST